MRLRMKTIYAGPAGNYQPGDLAEFAAKEGKVLVEGGYAEELGKPERRSPPAPSPVRETATPPAPQTATPPDPEVSTPPAPEKTDL